MLAVIAFVLQTDARFNAAAGLLALLENVATFVFTVDFCTRFASCPAKRPFLLSFASAIDLLTIVPFYLVAVFSFFSDVAPLSAATRVLRVLRILRVLRASKYVPYVSLMSAAFTASVVPIVMALGVMLIGALLFAYAMYYVERGEYDPELDTYVTATGRPSDFADIGISLYWTVITLTTVGYGELAPTTSAGKFVGSAAALTGCIIVSFPVSIYTEAFAKEYAEFEKSRRLAAELGRADLVTLLLETATAARAAAQPRRFPARRAYRSMRSTAAPRNLQVMRWAREQLLHHVYGVGVDAADDSSSAAVASSTAHGALQPGAPADDLESAAHRPATAAAVTATAVASQSDTLRTAPDSSHAGDHSSDAAFAAVWQLAVAKESGLVPPEGQPRMRSWSEERDADYDPVAGVTGAAAGAGAVARARFPAIVYDEEVNQRILHERLLRRAAPDHPALQVQTPVATRVRNEGADVHLLDSATRDAAVSSPWPLGRADVPSTIQGDNELDVRGRLRRASSAASHSSFAYAAPADLFSTLTSGEHVLGSAAGSPTPGAPQLAHVASLQLSPGDRREAAPRRDGEGGMAASATLSAVPSMFEESGRVSSVGVTVQPVAPPRALDTDADVELVLTPESFAVSSAADLLSDEGVLAAVLALQSEHRKRVWVEVRALEAKYRDDLDIEIARRWSYWMHVSAARVHDVAADFVFRKRELRRALTFLRSSVRVGFVGPAYRELLSREEAKERVTRQRRRRQARHRRQQQQQQQTHAARRDSVDIDAGREIATDVDLEVPAAAAAAPESSGLAALTSLFSLSHGPLAAAPVGFRAVPYFFENVVAPAFAALPSAAVAVGRGALDRGREVIDRGREVAIDRGLEALERLHLPSVLAHRLGVRDDNDDEDDLYCIVARSY